MAYTLPLPGLPGLSHVPTCGEFAPPLELAPMNAEERRIIEELFQKLEEVDHRSGLREPEADALIPQLAA